MGTLYLVATPIGNLEDMSPRAIRILREASLIAAEDTRHTGKLLKHFEIDTPLTSYFEHNKLNKLDFILGKLSQGDVALVSATPDEFRELARFKAIDGKTWNHPVVVGDVLLVRNGEEMAAFRLPRTAP